MAESQHDDHDDIGLMAAAFISPWSRVACPALERAEVAWLMVMGPDHRRGETRGQIFDTKYLTQNLTFELLIASYIACFAAAAALPRICII